MTASSPRPACPESLCTTTLPHHVHTDADGRSWCCGEYPYTPARPAAPDMTGGELREAIVETLAYWYPDSGTGQAHMLEEHQGVAEVILALPALRDLLTERDTLAAQVRAVEGLAEELDQAGERRENDDSWEQGMRYGSHYAATALRRALGTPTTGGGE